MEILVVNGSPKGDYSITLHSILYLEKLHPEHHFSFLNVGKRYWQLEKDFSEAASVLTKADLILFSYPVYTFLVPSQLHRFIELLKDSKIDLRGKFASQITTSKHFYDVTAHRFIQENCQDLGMKFITGFSADMDDLLLEKGQNELKDFFTYLEWCFHENHFEVLPAPLPKPSHCAVSPAEPVPHRNGDVVIVADLAQNDAQLRNMIARFQAVLPMESRVVNIREFPFRGGCVSCFHCASDGKCIYNDGFDEFLRTNIQNAQAIVLAFSIRDHSMGSVFKTYDDRQFCNGHRTVTMGTPFGYLVSGDLSHEQNLRTVIEGRAEVGGNFLAGIATDEFDPDGAIDEMASRLAWAAEHNYVQPPNFLGVGGMKIFRDLIWQMQGMMRADHRFFRKHGQYDFPQKKTGRMLTMYLVGFLNSNEKLRKKMGSKMNEGMIAPYQKVIKELEK